MGFISRTIKYKLFSFLFKKAKEKFSGNSSSKNRKQAGKKHRHAHG